MPLTAPPSAPPAAPAAPGDAPARTNPTTFRALADAFVVWQIGFRNDLASLRTWLVSYLTWQTTNIAELSALQTDVASKQASASTAATTATTKAAEAAVSEANALSYLQAYRATSYGALASDPTLDPNGNAPTAGDEYFNTTAGLVKRFNGVAWQASDIATANLAASTGAGLVGWIQNITGAVFRWIKDKLAERVSLEDFGGSPALADNKAAFDAAIASGYSPIYLKAETYITSPITVDRRVKFICSSGSLGTSVQRKAEIKLKNSSATHLFTFSGDSAKLLLENVSLNGNKQNQSLANCGIYAPAATAWSESVEMVGSHVRNCKGNGIQLGQNRNRLHVLLRSYIAENDGYGVYSVGAMDHKFADSEIGDCGLTCLYIDGDSSVQAANMVMTNTEVYHGGLLGTSEGHNVYIGGRVSEFTWLGGDCLRAERNGVHIAQLLLATPSAISIHGVRMSANSHSVTNTYSDIYDDRGGCAFFGLKHQAAGGVLPKYLYEIGPNSIRATMAFGALHLATSYGTAFTSNSAKLVALDDLRSRYPTDHPGLQFLHSSASNPLFAAFSSTTGQTTFMAQAGGTLFWGGGAGAVDTALFRQQADLLSVGATDAVNARTALWLTDGVATQFAEVGFAKLFVDTADGDLKVRFGDGTLKTIATNP